MVSGRREVITLSITYYYCLQEVLLLAAFVLVDTEKPLERVPVVGPSVVPRSLKSASVTSFRRK